MHRLLPKRRDPITEEQQLYGWKLLDRFVAPEPALRWGVESRVTWACMATGRMPVPRGAGILPAA
jgi:hypothetical protein